MAGSDVRVNMSVQTGQAEKNIKGVRGLLQGLGKDAKTSILTGVGLGAGVTAWNALGSAVSGVAGFLGDAVTAAIEEEESISRLTAALRANIPAWDGNTASIEAVIDSRKRLGFSDDEQRTSLAILVAATGDYNKALEIQATAMDLARLKGIDLATASDALTRVEGGSYRILKSLGIELRDNATATEALAAVQAVAAGQAEAYSLTSRGALSSLQIAFEDLKEEIGTEFLPVLIELATFARDDLIPAIKDFIAVAKSIDWEGIGEGIRGVINFFRDLHNIIVAVTGALVNFTSKSVGTRAPIPGPRGGTTPAPLFPKTTAPTYNPAPRITQYAEGTDYVPSTGAALLHQGEMVIPRDEAQQLRAGSGGNTYIVNVQGLVKAENPEEILRTLQRLGYLMQPASARV